MKEEGRSPAEAFPLSYAIFELARTHKAFGANLLRELDLYPGQELILMQLWQHGKRTQSQLVEHLKLDPSTVAKSLRRLENAGLVVRRTSPEDRRASIVSLTKKGAALEKKVNRVWRELERATAADLTADQQAEIRRLLHMLESHITRATGQNRL